MSRVFFVHPIKPDKNDITAALQFGDDAAFINTDYVFPDQIDDEELPSTCQSRMIDAAQRFDPLTDYLAIVGDHLQLVAFASLLGTQHGRFRVLRWDRDARGYLPVWIGEARIGA